MTLTNEVQGEIGYFKLTDWWLSVLTEDDRKTIIERYQPVGGSSYSLTHGDIKTIQTATGSQTVIGFLSNLLTWFQEPALRHIAYKIIDKADQLISKKGNVLNKHFFYQAKMQVYYRNRDEDPFALDKAIEACYQQIELSESALAAWQGLIIPTHAGFKQLCIIREKQGNYEEVIKLAQTALNHGWNGDWEKRIDKCKKKIDKLQK